MYLLQGQRLDWGEGGAAAYEDVAEVRAAGLGSTSAPPTHPRSQFFSLPFCFFGCSLCLLLPHVLLPSNSSLLPRLFFQKSRLSFLPSCLFYSLSLFIALDWACIRSISNANVATWRYRSNALPIASLFKGVSTIFNPVLLVHFSM